MGRLNTSLFRPANEDEGRDGDDVVGGARRRGLNKGSRISCLIENLASDQRDEGDEAADSEVESFKLGRDRLSQLQSMFSGGASACPDEDYDESTPYTEFSELKDEGLVSTNLQRFSSGNILGSQAARKASSETNYIDRKHIVSVTAKAMTSIA